MTEKIILNEEKDDFAILQFNEFNEFNDIQLVTKIEVRNTTKQIKDHRELCTYPITREAAIKKAKEIYADPFWL
ncbi:hypothetical protein [Microcoleus sp. Pol11C1]